MTYEFNQSPLYRLLLSSHKFDFPRGQVVHALEDREFINLIISGYVKRYLLTREGNTSIQVIYGPNDIFPMTQVFEAIYGMNLYTGDEQYYYEAMTPITIHSIAKDAYTEALNTNPEIYKDLLYCAGTRFNTYIHQLEDLSLGSGIYRVAHLLVFLADKFGHETDAGTVIDLPLTQQDVADILNVARETASHQLTKLKSRGMIISNGKTISIPDINKLTSIYSPLD